MRRILAILAVLLVAVAPAAAQPWNTFQNFSTTSNPSPPWSYGWKVAPTGAFTLFDRQYTIQNPLRGWTSVQFPGNSPYIAVNPTLSTILIQGTTIMVPPCATFCAPGEAGGQAAVFRFTVPSTGNYSISALFQKIDLGNTNTARGSIIVNTQTVFSSLIDVDGNPTPFVGGPYPLAAGFFVDFVVSPGSSAIGGATWVDGNVSPGPPTCFANCDGSTVPPILNVNDFICFQTRYAQNDPRANCDGSTILPVLNVHDFICFQTKYAQGCL